MGVETPRHGAFTDHELRKYQFRRESAVKPTKPGNPSARKAKAKGGRGCSVGMSGILSSDISREISSHCRCCRSREWTLGCLGRRGVDEGEKVCSSVQSTTHWPPSTPCMELKSGSAVLLLLRCQPCRLGSLAKFRGWSHGHALPPRALCRSSSATPLWARSSQQWCPASAIVCRSREAEPPSKTWTPCWVTVRRISSQVELWLATPRHRTRSLPTWTPSYGRLARDTWVSSEIAAACVTLVFVRKKWK